MQLGRFSEERARYHAAEILLGLEHIHAKRIVFRDLKLENVLLDHEGHCKITDFGLALLLEDGADPNDACGYHGTPGYTAPEIICGRPSTYISDYFSFGVVLYMMLSGMAPFGGFGNDSDALAVRSQVEFDDDSFTIESISLLSGLLQKEPSERLGALSIDQIKQHDFFREVDWARLELGCVPAPFQLATGSVPKPRLRVRLKGPRGPVPPPYRRLTLPDEFRRALDPFPYVDEDAAQQDLIQVIIDQDR